MSSRSLHFFLLNAAVIAVMAGCAKINTPTGGPRDKKPPVVVESEPAAGARNFKGKEVVITFDEYVQLDNINEKFMVSPPLKKKPRVYLRGKSLITAFEEKLQDSTTYTFYFQDAIKDLNEGNKLDDYRFVFSTGNVIDSLSVTGNAYSSYSLEAPEKTLILMYRNPDDSAVIKQIPDYISRIDEYGYFRIDNVRPGDYHLFALKDDDNSRTFNLPDEEFAFSDSVISVSPEKNYLPVKKDTTAQLKPDPKVKPATAEKKQVEAETHPALKGKHQLTLFTAEGKVHYLKSSVRPDKYMLSYILSLPPDTMKFKFRISEADNKGFKVMESRNRDTVNVWLTDSSLYNRPLVTTIVSYPFTDSLKRVVYKEDTIPLRYVFQKAPRSGKVKRTVYKPETNLSTGQLKPGRKIAFISVVPFTRPDEKKISLWDVTDSLRKSVPYKLVFDTLSPDRIIFDAQIIFGKKYLFIADSAAFGNIVGEHSDSVGYKFSLRDPESYSKLTVNVVNCKGPSIIQLLDKSDKIIAWEPVTKDGKVIFPLIDNGTYRLRVIYDLNGDGRWTTGDYQTKKQPEPVSFYPGEIDLKPGWNLDLDQDWDISVKNFKDQKLRTVKKNK